MNWKIVYKNTNSGIILFEGYNPDVPLRAWSVIVANNIVTKHNINIFGNREENKSSSEKKREYFFKNDLSS